MKTYMCENIYTEAIIHQMHMHIVYQTYQLLLAVTQRLPLLEKF
jgi:hypothetical protein